MTEPYLLHVRTAREALTCFGMIDADSAEPVSIDEAGDIIEHMAGFRVTVVQDGVIEDQDGHREIEPGVYQLNAEADGFEALAT